MLSYNLRNMVTSRGLKKPKPQSGSTESEDEKNLSIKVSSKAKRCIVKGTAKKLHSKLKVEKVAETYPYRLNTTGSKDGTSLISGKLPVNETKEPYLWPFFQYIMDNEEYKVKLCIDDIIPLVSDENNEELKLSGRGADEKTEQNNPYKPYWQGMIYTHPEPLNNTVAWREKWGQNIVTMLNKFIINSSKYRFDCKFEYKGDKNPEGKLLLDDLLSTEEIFKIIETSYGNTTMEDLLKDDNLLEDYFHADQLGKVRLYWARQHAYYPGMNGNIQEIREDAVKSLFDEELKNLPTL
jgi:hypothetical protein